jgi:Ca-activated chloride channel family protein
MTFALTHIPDSFVEPARLWLLVVVAALAVAYVLAQYRRRAYAMRFTNLELLDRVIDSRPGLRRHIPPIVFLAAMAALVVGFARPASDTEVPKEEATIILAIDTSLSMNATDVRPNRMESAKEAAIEFVESLPDDINLGLISFNGVPTVHVLPGTNHQAAISAIEGLETGPATAIGEAIIASLKSIETLSGADRQVPSRIVVMSDGKTTVGRPDEEAVEQAQRQGIPVSTIAFGTDAGIIVLPETEEPVAVPVDTVRLAEIADATGGEFFTATSLDELRNVYTDIGSQVTFETVRDEIGPAYIGLGLILLFATALLSMLWFSRLP